MATLDCAQKAKLIKNNPVGALLSVNLVMVYTDVYLSSLTDSK
jgi:hypothetical protein